ncbi:MAG: hypothetical protein GF353_30070 [Candidatus Lokiarchaeota archaeon]|nr:hypothetical protein [Candidatus Lokiarchaeota archaeon]
MGEELDDLKFEEFQSLSDLEKWQFFQNLKKLIHELKIKADKNCEECEKNLLTAEDINIDLYFQDWRECSEHCEECGKEELVNMCQLQFELMNHIANSLLEVQRKQNILTQIVLKRDEAGSKLLREFMRKKEELEKKEERADDIYQ